MKISYAVLMTVGVLLLLLSPSVQAQNTVCDNRVNLAPDGTPSDSTSTNNATPRWYMFEARANRSYAIMLDNLDDDSGIDSILFLDIAVQANCAGDPVSGTVSNACTVEPVSCGFLVGSDRIAIKSDASQSVFIVVNGLVASFQTFELRIVETTQFNPLWSTSGGFETFYRFQNTTNASCSVTLRMVDNGGMEEANVTFSIAANSTAPTRNTGPTDLNIANDQAGSATITHNCPPGAIQVDGFTGIFGATTAVLPIKIVTRETIR
ncbi:MAG: hypothetical protein L0338_28175 [Acidobacteria bacterium]|nr:hypothetical protein [Acidobacteriota bacterium]